jgi:hypothetical protein
MLAFSAESSTVCPGTSTQTVLFGTSSPNSTATTPGSSSARAASRRTIVADGACARTKRA